MDLHAGLHERLRGRQHPVTNVSPALVAAIAGGTGVFAGALITALVTVVSAIRERRHMHERWLLDHQLDAYASYNAAINDWQRAWAGVVTSEAPDANRLIDTLQQLMDRLDRMYLLAPEATHRKAALVAEMINVAGKELSSHGGRINGKVIAAAERELETLRPTLYDLSRLQKADLQDRAPRRWGRRRPGR